MMNAAMLNSQFIIHHSPVALHLLPTPCLLGIMLRIEAGTAARQTFTL